MTTKIKFTKMHGAGNDYIYVDTTRYPIADPEKKAIEWSKFHTGIGSDGLILRQVCIRIRINCQKGNHT